MSRFPVVVDLSRSDPIRPTPQERRTSLSMTLGPARWCLLLHLESESRPTRIVSGGGSLLGALRVHLGQPLHDALARAQAPAVPQDRHVIRSGGCGMTHTLDQLFSGHHRLRVHQSTRVSLPNGLTVEHRSVLRPPKSDRAARPRRRHARATLYTGSRGAGKTVLLNAIDLRPSKTGPGAAARFLDLLDIVRCRPHGEMDVQMEISKPRLACGPQHRSRGLMGPHV